MAEQSGSLRRALRHSENLSDSFQTILGSEGVVDTLSGQIALAYLGLCLEHRESILLLVKVGAFASATALQRPLLEAFVAGAWVNRCATDDVARELAAYKRTVPKFETMAQRLRAEHEFGEAFEKFRVHYHTLADYAHGHRRQLSRWLAPGSVEPRYQDDQMAEALEHSDTVGLYAAILRENIVRRPIDALADRLDAHLARVKVEQDVRGGQAGGMARGDPKA